MNFLRASALLAGLVQASVASNFEEIESETMLSDIPKTEPVTFKATLTNLWTEETHPYMFPENANWSRLVFASHSDAYSMWCDECMATMGVENIAEMGNPTVLRRDEIIPERKMKNVLDDRTAPGMMAEEDAESMIEGSLCVDYDHPYVSAVSMIAPSPDWFSGMYNLPLFKSEGDEDPMWYSKFSVYIFPWDAGTEDGDMFMGDNPATSPQEMIYPFMPDEADTPFVSENADSGDLQVLPVGMITFEIDEDAECMPADAEEMFGVRLRTADGFRERETDCEDWLATGRNQRCRKQTRDMDGEKTGNRVRDHCRMSCGM